MPAAAGVKKKKKRSLVQQAGHVLASAGEGALDVLGMPQRLVESAIMSPARELGELLDPGRFELATGQKASPSLAQALGLSGNQKANVSSYFNDFNVFGKPGTANEIGTLGTLARIGTQLTFTVASDPLMKIGVGAVTAPRRVEQAIEAGRSAVKTAEELKKGSALAETLAKLGFTSGTRIRGGTEMLGRLAEVSPNMQGAASMIERSASNWDDAAKAALGYTSRLTVRGHKGQVITIPGTERIGAALSSAGDPGKVALNALLGGRNLGNRTRAAADAKAEVGRLMPALRGAAREELHGNPFVTLAGVEPVKMENAVRNTWLAHGADKTKALVAGVMDAKAAEYIGQHFTGALDRRALLSMEDMGSSMLRDETSPLSMAAAEIKAKVLKDLAEGVALKGTGRVVATPLDDDALEAFARTWDTTIKAWANTGALTNRQAGMDLPKVIEGLASRAGASAGGKRVLDDLMAFKEAAGHTSVIDDAVIKSLFAKHEKDLDEAISAAIAAGVKPAAKEARRVIRQSEKEAARLAKTKALTDSLLDTTSRNLPVDGITGKPMEHIKSILPEGHAIDLGALGKGTEEFMTKAQAAEGALRFEAPKLPALQQAMLDAKAEAERVLAMGEGLPGKVKIGPEAKRMRELLAPSKQAGTRAKSLEDALADAHRVVDGLTLPKAVAAKAEDLPKFKALVEQEAQRKAMEAMVQAAKQKGSLAELGITDIKAFNAKSMELRQILESQMQDLRNAVAANPGAAEDVKAAIDALAALHPELGSVTEKYLAKAAATNKAPVQQELKDVLANTVERAKAEAGLKADALKTNAEYQRLQAAVVGGKRQNAEAVALRKAWEEALTNTKKALAEKTKAAVTHKMMVDDLMLQRASATKALRDYEANLAALRDIAENPTLKYAPDVVEHAKRQLEDAATQLSTRAQIINLHQGTLLREELVKAGVAKEWLTGPDADLAYHELVLKFQEQGLDTFRAYGLDQGPGEIWTSKNFTRFLNAKQQHVQFSRVSRVWRSWAILRPGFSNRNFIGAFMNNLADGTQVKHYRQAAKWAALLERGEDLPPQAREWMVDVAANELKRTSRMADLTEHATSLAKVDEFTTKASTFLDTHAIPKLTMTSLTPGAGRVPLAEAKLVPVEENVRLAQFLALREQGLDYTTAMERVRAVHFDYTDLSTFDRNVRKHIPFWTYRSRNLPMQVQMMMHNPTYSRGLLMGREGLRANDNDQSNIPPWVGGLAMPWGGTVLDLNNYIPASDLIKMSDSATQLGSNPYVMADVAAGMFGGPAVSTTALVFNRSLYTHQNIVDPTLSGPERAVATLMYALKQSGAPGEVTINWPKLLGPLLGKGTLHDKMLTPGGVPVSVASRGLGILPGVKTYEPR